MHDDATSGAYPSPLLLSSSSEEEEEIERLLGGAAFGGGGCFDGVKREKKLKIDEVAIALKLVFLIEQTAAFVQPFYLDRMGMMDWIG